MKSWLLWSERPIADNQHRSMPRAAFSLAAGQVAAVMRAALSKAALRLGAQKTQEGPAASRRSVKLDAA